MVPRSSTARRSGGELQLLHRARFLKRRQQAGSDLLSKQRRDRVPELELAFPPAAENREAVGERHEPLELGGAEAAVVPVKRAHPRTRLTLDRRGWCGRWRP